MARLRKEKGRPSHPNPKAKSTQDLKAQLFALGGTQEDVDLIKSVSGERDAFTSTPHNEDPELSKDVTKFMKDLDIDGSNKSNNNNKIRMVGHDHKKSPRRRGKGNNDDNASHGSGPPPPPQLRKEKNNIEELQQTSGEKGGNGTSVGRDGMKNNKNKNKNKNRNQSEHPPPPLAQTTTSVVPSQPGSVITTTTTTTQQQQQQLPTKTTTNPSKSQITFPPTSLWHAAIPPLPPHPSSATTTTPIPPTTLTTLTSKAASLHQHDLHTFQSPSTSTSTSEAHFLTQIIHSGTLSDRLSALTLLVQSSPVHGTRALETLRGMAERGKGKGGREECLKALRCVVDWWVGGGAPDRKLRYFRDQPLTHPSITDTHLLVWYFEDWLKKYFFSILQILETLSLDPLPYVRTQSLTLIFTLLRDKPEQEQNLLRLLVNKLGDTEKPISSRTSHLLLQLLQSHPSMKSVVVREVTALVLRPGLGSSAAAASSIIPGSGPGSAPGQGKEQEQRHGRTNQHIRFAADAQDPGTASNTTAKDRTKSRDDKNQKNTTSSSAAAAATTTNASTNMHARYYAAITLNQIVLRGQGDRGVAVQLMDVYFEMFKEVLGEGGGGRDDEGVGGGDDDDDNKGDSDLDEQVVKKDKKGRVVVVGEKKGKGKKVTMIIGKGKEKGKARGKRRGKEIKGAAGFAEVEDGYSKLVSAILTGVNRALPFVGMGGGEDVRLNKHIDTLFLITHKSTFNISLQALVLLQQIAASSSSSSSTMTTKGKSIPSVVDRYYRTLYASLHDPRLATSSKQAMYLNLLFKSLKADVAVGSKDRVKALVRRFVQVFVSGGATEFVAGGLYLLGELFSSTPGLRDMMDENSGEGYDPKKRDPRYACASSSPLWELTPLVHHYHPAISLHARQLLRGEVLTASADLTQNTVMHFLDRFVYKNAKKGKGGGKGGSAMQPAASGFEGGGVKLRKGEEVVERVNEEGFLKKRVEDVPVDQMFYYRFFSRKRTKGKEVSEDEEEEEETEDEIWKAMKATMPKIGDEDEDEDEDDDQLLIEDEDDDEDPDEDEDEDEDNDDKDEDPDEDEDEDDLDLIFSEPDSEWDGIGSKKRKLEEEKGNSKRKRQRSSLPTFASYEDYANMIELE